MAYIPLKKSLMGYVYAKEDKDIQYMAWSKTDGKELIRLSNEHEVLTAEKKTLTEKNTALTNENDSLNENIKDLNSIISDLKKELSFFKNNFSEEKTFNEKLIRIIKNKANAERKITPKKQHTGYLLLQQNLSFFGKQLSEKSEYYGVNDKVEIYRIRIFKYTFQTPYKTKDTSITNIEEFIRRDLNILGTTVSPKTNYSYKDKEDIDVYNDYKKTNFIFNLRINNKHNSDFYELEFLSYNELQDLFK